MKQLRSETVKLEKFIGGGQVLGVLENGKKIFVWGGLPGETVSVQLTKNKSSYAEGMVMDVLEPSKRRIAPKDPESYLSTSPWQIMRFDYEQLIKAQLIREAFELHGVRLNRTPEVYSDGRQYGYRNKVEFSWWWDNESSRLDLAFFRRGGKGKIPVNGTSLAPNHMNELAVALCDLLRRKQVPARALKSLLIRSTQSGENTWQLYIKDTWPKILLAEESAALPAIGGEIIYSDPRSPASRLTERLARFGQTTLQDTLLRTPFRYSAESFFQVNLPVYERALKDMQHWIVAGPVVDMYSGVGSIGLTIGGPDVALVESDANAYRELKNNITALKRPAQAVLAPSEKALDSITPKATIIVDPPRAGLHRLVVKRLLTVLPPRLVYLSCNPVTQARDVRQLLGAYEITHAQGYNFFPRTPHIEHLVVLKRL